MTDSTMDIVAEAANSPLDIECTMDDTQWSELVAPAPMGIAVLSQLMICTSHVADFRIDQIEKTHISFIKHPKSFRTSLVQIVNESYNAFMKAHVNMEKIQLQVAQVPDYVKECVNIIKSDNKVAIEKLVPRRLEFIKESADDGEKLSKEVCNAFDLLGQLIQQVLLAISASQGAKEQKIKELIQEHNVAETQRKLQSLNREKKYLQKEVEDNQQLKNRGQQYVMEEQNRSRGILERVFFRGEKEQKIENFSRTVEDAEKRLEKAKENIEKADVNMGKIEKEFIENFKNMKIDVKKDISADEMIEILQNGTKLLGQLQGHWAGMTLYFKSINSYIEKVMNKHQNKFVGDAKDAQKETWMIDFMTDSIKKSLETSIKSHRTAATYVKVSNNYILEPLRKMHGMLAIEPAKMEQAQEELLDLCERASKGIRIIFTEDGKKTIKELENALQSLDPGQSIQN